MTRSTLRIFPSVNGWVVQRCSGDMFGPQYPQDGVWSFESTQSMLLALPDLLEPMEISVSLPTGVQSETTASGMATEPSATEINSVK